jgi:cell division protein FtsZ
VLYQGVKGVTDLMVRPGLINLDFADVRSIMSEGGAALMAIGIGRSENRAQQAAEEAIHSQLLDISIDGARGILFNVTGSEDMSLFEVNEAAEIIRRTAHPEANIIFGAVIDPNLNDALRITVIATGFDSETDVRSLPAGSARRSGRGPVPGQNEPPPVPDNENIEIPPFLRRSRRKRQ